MTTGDWRDDEDYGDPWTVRDAVCAAAVVFIVVVLALTAAMMRPAPELDSPEMQHYIQTQIDNLQHLKGGR